MNRFLRPKSLFIRTLLILFIPTVLVQLVTVYVFYDRHWETLVRRLSSSLGGEIAMVTHLIDHTSPETRQKILADAGKNLYLEFVWQDLNALSLPAQQDSSGMVDQILREEIGNRLDQEFYVSARDDSERVRIIVRLDDGYLLTYAHKKRLFSYTANLVIAWMVGSSILLFGIAAVFLRNQIRPIRKLAEAAEKLGKGQDVNDLKPSGAIEIRQATLAFRIMRDRIRRQIQQRTDMLSGISHDLRTPLTRLKLELALLPQTPDIQAMQADIEEMRQMVESYLDFARGDGGEEPQIIEVTSFIDEVAASFIRAGEAIRIEPMPQIEIIGRKNALRRCVGNLIGNACRYGERVWISTDTHPRGIDLHIDDDGPGIPENMHEEVFKPFRRLDDSRNAETGGVGLGLSVARDIARRHGGDIILSKAKQGGLRATLHLPI